MVPERGAGSQAQVEDRGGGAQDSEGDLCFRGPPRLRLSKHGAAPAVPVTVLVPLAETGAIVVLVDIPRAVFAVVTLVAFTVIAVTNGVVPVPVIAVFDPLLVAVAVPSCHGRFLEAARCAAPLPAIVAPDDDAKAIVGVTIAGRESAPELHAIRVTAAETLVVSQVSRAVRSFTFEVEVAIVAAMVLACAKTLAVSTLVHFTTLHRLRVTTLRWLRVAVTFTVGLIGAHICSAR